MTYLVGFSPHKDDHAAIELACMLARSDHEVGADVEVLTVVPPGWPTPVAGDVDREFEAWVAAEGESSATEAAAMLAEHPDVDGRAVWIHGRSTPQTLLDEAERSGASLLVLGSDPHGAEGQITLTSKTDRLLHSSPVPVAIAPRGFRAPAPSRVTRVTIAYRGDEETSDLLEKVAPICMRVGALIRVVTFAVRGETMFPPRISGAEDMVAQQWREQASQALQRASRRLQELDVPTESIATATATGSSWAAAMSDVEWDEGDLLVVGSSSTHPLAQVFLGSSASKILRNSTVPVIVVP